MSSTYVRWHERPHYIDKGDRRERYEQRLALDWCRSNGNPHLVPTDSDEPRCSVTGMSLTPQQRFEQECG